MSVPTIDASLRGAYETLYEVFGRYRRPTELVCSALKRDGIEPRWEVMRGERLRRLTGDELAMSGLSALTTWGGLDTFRHFLPRLLELVSRGGEGLCEVEVVLGKLKVRQGKVARSATVAGLLQRGELEGRSPSMQSRGDCQCALSYSEWWRWPSHEASAVRRWLERWWLERWWLEKLERPLTTPYSVEDRLCAIARAHERCPGFSDSLERWRVRPDEPSHLLAFVYLVADPERGPACGALQLGHAFWPREGRATLLGRLDRPAHREALEHAILHDVLPDHADELQEALTVLERRAG